MKEVVGVAFFKNGKLLISQSVKSEKNNKFTFVARVFATPTAILRTSDKTRG